MAERGRKIGRMELCLKMDKDLRNQRIIEVLQRPDFIETTANIITGLKQSQHHHSADLSLERLWVTFLSFFAPL